jgi:hypothetical protein
VNAPLIVSSLLLSALLVGCGRPDYLGVPPSDGVQTISVREAADHRNAGRTVAIRATVASVCQDEGCWLTISDGTAELKMKFLDPSLGVPTDLHGDVLAQGVLRESVVNGVRIPELHASGIRYLDR